MAIVEAPRLIGHQQPRIRAVPQYVSSLGDEAVDFCRSHGLVLDPAQELVLREGLGMRPDGKWASFEVAVCEARQNGKGVILEARELVGLYLLHEPLIIHSAHMFDTSMEAYTRLLDRIEENPDLDREVKRKTRSHGAEGLELKSGARIRFRTRTKGGGRGFSANCVILDEAMVLPDMFHDALLPTVSAQSELGNPQVWYAGSAVDQYVHEYGVVFSRIRERGISGADPALAYFEWSVDCPNPEEISDEMLEDPNEWAKANPGLGIRISQEHIEKELRSMDRRGFAVERLGVGDWPRTDLLGHMAWTLDQWKELADPESEIAGPMVFAFDIAPDRRYASIAVVGRRKDGLLHVELVDSRAGTGWISERIVELQTRHGSSVVLCDSIGPAGSLVPDLQRRGVRITEVNTPQAVQACGLIFDAVEQKALRHLGEPELTSAVKAAVKRPLGDAWAWSRRNSGADITPLVACTLGVWQVMTGSTSEPSIAFA